MKDDIAQHSKRRRSLIYKVNPWHISSGNIGWTILFLLFMTSVLLPNCLISWPLTALASSFLQSHGFMYPSGELSYEFRRNIFLVGCLLFVASGIAACARTLQARQENVATNNSLIALNFFLFLILSSAFRTMTTESDVAVNYWHLGFYFSAVNLIVIFLPKALCLRLAYLMIYCIATQSLIAIIYWVTGISQYTTPSFGGRTAGTFDNPGTLYPLCLMALPLTVCLIWIEERAVKHALLIFLSYVIIFGLVLTFCRAGMLAMAISLIALARSPLEASYNRGSLHRRPVLLLLCGLLLFGGIFLRTGGKVIGTSSDRSFWGRPQIWRVALTAFANDPLTGGGLGSYSYRQQQLMTNSLRQFNPAIDEPKSLGLYIAVEQGVVGLIFFCFFALSYRNAHQKWYRYFGDRKGHIKVFATLMGSNIGMMSIVVAGFFDTPVITSARAPSTFMAIVLIGISLVLLRTPSEKEDCHDKEPLQPPGDIAK